MTPEQFVDRLFAKQANWGNLAKTVAGAGAGLGLAYGEQQAGMVPENMGVLGQATHYGLNAAYGGMLGNPTMRNRMFFDKVLRRAGPGRYQNTSRFRPSGALVPLTMAATPRLATLADTSDKGIRALNSGLTENPGAVGEWINNPVQKATDSVSNWAKEYGPGIGAMFAANAGSGLGGSAAGYMAGGALGSLVAPDDENLSYEDRRSRERTRSTLSLLGAPLGGAAGLYLANRYGLPQLAEKFFSK